MSRLLNFFIALVWFVNGLFCKLLDLVPRHQQIVARILGEEHSALLTKTIGALEVCLAIWVLSKFQHRLCTWTQIVLVATMNAIEFAFVPDLLLFGRFNIAVAAAFIIVLLLNERNYNDKNIFN